MTKIDFNKIQEETKQEMEKKAANPNENTPDKEDSIFSGWKPGPLIAMGVVVLIAVAFSVYVVAFM